ncbi:MAG: hypothetical protein ACYS22_20540 [Planctomycetota bacterium]|jgi:hypothetical protein
MEPLYFESPERAVEATARMLEGEAWGRLSRYYDLRGTDVPRRDLESGRFFLRDPDAPGHPAFSRYRQPFSPGFVYRGHTEHGDGTATVEVEIRVDEGGGPMRHGLQSFAMRRSEGGWQLLADDAPAVKDGGAVPGPLLIPLPPPPWEPEATPEGPAPEEVTGGGSGREKTLRQSEVDALLSAVHSEAPVDEDEIVARIADLPREKRAGLAAAQFKRCLRNLVGGSGHLASYHVEAGTLAVTGTERLGDGLTRWTFRALGGRQSEFGVATEEAPDELVASSAEVLTGMLVLDEALRIALDEQGGVRLSPWKCLAPKFWLKEAYPQSIQRILS